MACYWSLLEPYNSVTRNCQRAMQIRHLSTARFHATLTLPVAHRAPTLIHLARPCSTPEHAILLDFCFRYIAWAWTYRAVDWEGCLSRVAIKKDNELC